MLCVDHLCWNERHSLSGTGASDFVNAITVAADLIQKRIKESAVLEKDNVTKRIVLVTDLLSPVGHSFSSLQASFLATCHICSFKSFCMTMIVCQQNTILLI